MCGGFPLNQPALHLSLCTKWETCSSIQHDPVYLEGSGPAVEGGVVQDRALPSGACSSEPQAQSHPEHPAVQLPIGGSQEPFLGFDNLLEETTELRKTVYLLDYQFMIKRYTNPDGRTVQCGKGLEVALQVHHPPTPARVHGLGRSLNPGF